MRVTTAPQFRTAVVQRANLMATISATGTVEPEEVVDVGAQVAGRVLSLGEDAQRSTPEAPRTIDYTSVVQRGTVLALIDDAVYKAQQGQAQADRVDVPGGNAHGSDSMHGFRDACRNI